MVLSTIAPALKSKWLSNVVNLFFESASINLFRSDINAENGLIVKGVSEAAIINF